MTLRTSVAAALLIVTGSCHVGPSADHFLPATAPSGILTHVSYRGGSASGELLAVSDSSLLLLLLTKGTAPVQIAEVHYSALRKVTFRQLSLKLEGARRPASGIEGQLRMASRFPQGIDATLMDRLLQAYHLEQVEVVR